MPDTESTLAPTIRPIRPEDNPQVALIIRQVMTEFGAVGQGYSIQDDEVDHMYEAYPAEDSVFYVVESQGQVLGCGGIGPLQGGDADVCELRKMYFLPKLRALGLGRRLLRMCLDEARSLGYGVCYLETLENMTAARQLYRQFGFEGLDRPMGETGHCGCNSWMVKSLATQS